MKVYILPHTLPTIGTYPDYTNLFFAFGNRPEVQRWLVSRTIGLLGKWDPETYGMIVNFYDAANPWYCSPAEACPYLTTQIIDESVLRDMGVNFVHFLITQLNNGYYINLFVDKYELSCYRHYHEIHYNHAVLLYGYDLNQEIFFLAGFVNGTGFKLYTATFEEITKSFFQKSGDIKYQELFVRYGGIDAEALGTSYCTFLQRYNDSDEYIKSELNYYLNESRYPVFPDVYMGISVYDLYKRYCQHLSDTSDISTRLFRPALQVIYSHKIMLKEAYHQIFHKKNPDPTILNNIDILIRETLIIRNRLIKYNYSHQMNKAEQIIQQIDWLKQLEYNTVTEMIETP